MSSERKKDSQTKIQRFDSQCFIAILGPFVSLRFVVAVAPSHFGPSYVLGKLWKWKCINFVGTLRLDLFCSPFAGSLGRAFCSAASRFGNFPLVPRFLFYFIFSLLSRCSFKHTHTHYIQLSRALPTDFEASRLPRLFRSTQIWKNVWQCECVCVRARSR